MASKQQTTPETPETPDAETPVNALDLLTSEPEETAETGREIDQRIKDFVDRGEAMTRAKPRKWFVTPEIPEDELKKILADAKRHARDTGRVFRRKSHDNPRRLVYRVTAKPDKDTPAETPAETKA